MMVDENVRRDCPPPLPANPLIPTKKTRDEVFHTFRSFFLLAQFGVEECRGMILGKPAPLESSFRLTYYALLNLMSRAEGQMSTEYVIQRSFHQFQHDKVKGGGVGGKWGRGGTGYGEGGGG